MSYSSTGGIILYINEGDRGLIYNNNFQILLRNSVRDITGTFINHGECLFICNIILVDRVVIMEHVVLPMRPCKFKRAFIWRWNRHVRTAFVNNRLDIHYSLEGVHINNDESVVKKPDKELHISNKKRISVKIKFN